MHGSVAEWLRRIAAFPRGFAALAYGRLDPRVSERFEAQLAFLDQMHNAVIATDLEGTVTYWNRHAETLFQWTGDEALGKNIADLMVPRGSFGRLQLVTAKLRAEHHWQGEAVLRRKDGTTFFSLTTAATLQNAAGEPVGLVGVTADVSDRKRAEERATQAAHVTAALARVGRELISSMSSPSLLLHALCRVTAEVLGCELSHTLLLRPDEGVFVPIASERDVPERRAALGLVRVPQQMVTEILPGLAQDDVTVVRELPPNYVAQMPALAEYESICLALRRGSELIGVQTAQRRRAERPFSETQLQIARGIAQLASLALSHARTVDELEQANRIKSDFVATMSHELRTPLHVILGYADLLLSGEFGSLSDPQSDAVERLYRRAQELQELIVSTLDVSRIDSGRATVNASEVSLTDLLAEIEADYQRRVGSSASGPVLSVTVAPGMPPLRTDAMKLKVVLKNLVSNAVKFTERGRVSVEARPHEGGTSIEVADTGIGIAPDLLPHLFQPFRQGDPALTRRYGGVGLGLYIVHRLLELLGGRIEVASEIGKGSRFTVWLPPALPPPEAQPTAAQPTTAAPAAEPPAADRPRPPHATR